MLEAFIVLAESFTMTLSDGIKLLMRVRMWYNVSGDLFLIYASGCWLNISFSLILLEDSILFNSLKFEMDPHN